MQTDQTNDEVISANSLATLTKAEIDMQIATAKRFPRVLSKVKADMLSFATLDEDTAQSCFYTLRRKDKEGNTKIIQGPSIRLGEIALSCYGNIKAGARVISNDGKMLVAQGLCSDLEKNVTIDMQTTRRITTKSGKTFSEDMQVVTGNAACAIALRNAIFKVVPLALVKPVLEEAKRVAVGDVKSLAAKREKTLTRLKQMGASEESILAAVDARKIEDIDLPKLEVLIGLGTAIRDGETTLEEAFPSPQQRKPEVVQEPSPSPAAAQPSQEPQAEPAASEPAATKTPQDELMEFVRAEGYGFPELIEWAVSSGNLDAPVNTPEEIPAESVKRWLKAKRGLLVGLAAARKASQ